MHKLRISTIGATWDLDIPVGFDFHAFVRQVKADGQYLSPNLFIPLNQIVFIALIHGGAAASFHMQGGNA